MQMAMKWNLLVCLWTGRRRRRAGAGADADAGDVDLSATNVLEPENERHFNASRH